MSSQSVGDTEVAPAVSAQGSGPDPSSPVSDAFRDSVSDALSAFLGSQRPLLAKLGPELGFVHELATALVQGGKRLRPAFAFWSFVAASGWPVQQRPVLAAAASLELLHVSALVHDDVMDSSDLRRGQPSAHRQFQALHRQSGWVGDPAALGRAGAILLGDLLLMWSVEMVRACGLPEATLRPALPILERMRTEVTGGQYLDVVAQARPWASHGAGPDSVELALAEANRVVEFKSARYTVQRPCQMGAALGGGDERLHAALAAYGSPLGRAFQFRDDLLGVFGDPRLTGKPAGDDLREGKRTVLVAHAYASATPAGRRLLVERLGDPALDADGVAALQQVIADSGAAAACEAMITEAHTRALDALAPAEITAEGRTALSALAEAAVQRVA